MLPTKKSEPENDLKWIKPHINNGYYRIRFHGGRLEYVHRLVARKFIGPIPKGYCVNHKNGNKLDNQISNLEIVTLAENNHHAKRIGINMRGERQHNAKLKRNQVKTIRRLVKHKLYPYSRIAAFFSVSISTICDINKRRTWSWIH